MKNLNEKDYNTLKKLIRESVSNVLESVKKGLLLEMPYPRGVYKNKVDDKMPQVLINWCLVHYCTLCGRENLKKHWKDELRGHMAEIARLSLKKNDSLEKRRKVFDEVWYENDYNVPNTMNLTVCNKFLNENIDINSEEYETTILDCIMSYDNLVEAMMSRNISVIYNYIETI